MECPVESTYCKIPKCLQCVYPIKGDPMFTDTGNKRISVFSYTDTGLVIDGKQFVVSLGYDFFRINELKKITDEINNIECD